MAGKPTSFYFDELRRHEDDLHDAREDVIAPMRGFMAGAQRRIYDDARRFLEAQEANLSYADGNEARQMRELLRDATCYRGNTMQQVKGLLDELQAKVSAAVAAEREKNLRAVDERWERLAGMAEYSDLTPAQQQTLQQPFEDLKRSLQKQDLIAVIRDTVRRFDDVRYQDLLRQMTVWAMPASKSKSDGNGAGDDCVVEPRIEYISRSTLPISFDRAWLADEADVDAYLAALKQTLMQAIEEGKRVQV